MNEIMLGILGFGMPGIGEMAIIVFVIIFLFGGRKIPEFARGLGKAISEFKKGKNELVKELNDVKSDVTEVKNTVNKALIS